MQVGVAWGGYVELGLYGFGEGFEVLYAGCEGGEGLVIVHGGRELGWGSGVGAGHCGFLRGSEGL